jgi:tight adherence protein C
MEELAMTTQLITILAAGLFAAAILSGILAMVLRARTPTMSERLISMGAPQPQEPGPEAASTLEQIERSEPFTERVIVPALQWIATSVGRRLPGANAQAVSVRLARAGAPPSLTVEVFLGLKLAAAVVSAAVAVLMQLLVLTPSTPIMIAVWTVVSGIVGLFLPDLWVKDRTKKRQKAITLVLPDTIDILSISVEAGLGFDAAISRICQKAQNPLTAEFEKYLTEIRLGKARREALRQIQTRTGVDDLTTFIGAVIQADQLGVSMAKILRVQSEQLRVKRRQRAEQLAQQAPLKMLFPMILFIFPSVFIVILGPSIPQIMSAFS